MIRNSNQRIFSSKYAPDPRLNILWMDLTADPDGSIVKYYDRDTSTYIAISGAGGEAGGGHIIYDSTSAKPQRSKLKFVNATVTDSFADDTTIVTISESAGGGSTPNHQWDGSKLRFSTSSGGWGDYVDLKGTTGKTAYEAAQSGGYTGTEYQFNILLGQIGSTGVGESKISGTTSIAVGQLSKSIVITDKTAAEVLRSILFKTFTPTRDMPSVSITKNYINNLAIVGTSINVEYSANLNRGAIKLDGVYQMPASGLALTFTWGGVFSPSITDSANSGSTNTSLKRTKTGLIISLGNNKGTVSAAYDEGPIPLDSAGAEYQTLGKLAAGSTTSEVNIVGVYPIFANTASISTMTQQSLVAHGSQVQYSFPTESATEKETIEFPSSFFGVGYNFNTIKIEFINVAGQWEQEATLDNFSIDGTNRYVVSGGANIPYTRIKYKNTETKQSRTLRFTKV